MTIRPIIFSGPMVRALLDGRKTQTRRVLSPAPDFCGPGRASDHCLDRDCWGWQDGERGEWNCLDDGYLPTRQAFAAGDRLYVREAFRTSTLHDHQSPSQLVAACREAGYRSAWCPIIYEADQRQDNWLDGGTPGRFRVGMHMPRDYSRLTLAVTDVRVQRLQEISEEDAQAEGLVRAYEGWAVDAEGRFWGDTAREAFRQLWESLHGAEAWDANPWLVAISFEVHRRNVDQMREAA